MVDAAAQTESTGALADSADRKRQLKDALRLVEDTTRKLATFNSTD